MSGWPVCCSRVAAQGESIDGRREKFSVVIGELLSYNRLRRFHLAVFSNCQDGAAFIAYLVYVETN